MAQCVEDHFDELSEILHKLYSQTLETLECKDDIKALRKEDEEEAGRVRYSIKVRSERDFKPSVPVTPPNPKDPLTKLVEKYEGKRINRYPDINPYYRKNIILDFANLSPKNICWVNFCSFLNEDLV